MEHKSKVIILLKTYFNATSKYRIGKLVLTKENIEKSASFFEWKGNRIILYHTINLIWKVLNYLNEENEGWSYWQKIWTVYEF